MGLHTGVARTPAKERERRRKISRANRGRRRPDLARFNQVRTDLRTRRARCKRCGKSFGNHYEMIAHIASVHIEYHFTPERNARIAQTLKGHPVSRATRRKIGRANAGKIHTPETRLRISLSLMGRKNHQWRGGGLS